MRGQPGSIIHLVFIAWPAVMNKTRVRRLILLLSLMPIALCQAPVGSVGRRVWFEGHRVIGAGIAVYRVFVRKE